MLRSCVNWAQTDNSAYTNWSSDMNNLKPIDNFRAVLTNIGQYCDNIQKSYSQQWIIYFMCKISSNSFLFKVKEYVRS